MHILVGKLYHLQITYYKWQDTGNERQTIKRIFLVVFVLTVQGAGVVYCQKV